WLRFSYRIHRETFQSIKPPIRRTAFHILSNLPLRKQTSSTRRAYYSAPSRDRLRSLQMSIDAFTRHPASVGETYSEHLVFASGIGGRLLMAGIACLLHGIFPFLFERTGSRAIIALHARVTTGARGRINPTTVQVNAAR